MSQFALIPIGMGATPAVSINQPVTLVGRGRSCDVIIDRPSVSKVHAVLVNDGFAVLVRDLLTIGGTRLKGRSIHESILEPEDQIRFGAFSFKYVGPPVPPDQLNEPPAVWLHLSDMQSGRRWRFSRRVILLGSQEGCDVRVERADVAPLHAVICRVDAQTTLLRRLAHTLPLARNDAEVRVSLLLNADVLQIGSMKISVALTVGAGQPLPEPQASERELLEWSHDGVGDSDWSMLHGADPGDSSSMIAGQPFAPGEHADTVRPPADADAEEDV